jgi:hypothetical protein
MVPRGCVGDHDAIAHARNLKDVERRYADVIDGAAAIDAIEQCGGRTTAADRSNVVMNRVPERSHHGTPEQ